MFSDARRLAYPLTVLTVGRFLQPRPADQSDVPRSLELILAYDGRDTIAALEHPTLVFGGTADPYFTEPVQRKTAAALPDGQLTLIEGAKHGAFHERKPAFDRAVMDFLETT